MDLEAFCTNPACRRRFLFPDSRNGQTVRCPACKQTFIAGGSSTAAGATGGAGSAPPTGPAPDAPATGAGSTFGRFVVQEVLGSGAFGTVYRAFDPVLARDVALKVPNPGVVSDPKRVERFLRGDAKAAARLRHPHIVAVFDAGREGDHYYIAFEFIEGKKTLAHTIPDGGDDLARAVRVTRELAEALAYAHEQGVVHRDVKPANVMMDSHDRVHLTDFGLASWQGEEARITSDGAVMGTPSYIAPEHAAGQKGEARPAADQYAAGVVLYELLTGTVPFEGKTPVVLHNAIHTTPDSPRARRPAVPIDLETICLKAMAKLPEDRYPDCQALADDLRRWQEGEPITARRLSPRERLERWVRKEPKLATAMGVVAALVVLVAVLGAAFGAKQRQKNRDLTTANGRIEEALTDLDREAELARRKEREALGAKEQADRKAWEAIAAQAVAMLDHAAAVGEQGEIGQCLTELAQALELAESVPEKGRDRELVEVIRQNLAGWRRQAHWLADVRNLGPDDRPPHFSAAVTGLASGPEPDTVLVVGSGKFISHLYAHDLRARTLGRLDAAERSSRTVACDPKGELVLTVGEDGVAWLFDAVRGTPRGGPISPPEGVKFHCGVIFPRGQRIALGASDGTVYTFDRTADGWDPGPSVRHAPGFEVKALAVHPSGSRLLSGGGSGSFGEVIVWAVENKSLTLQLKRPQALGSMLPVTSAAFLPKSGAVFATGHGYLTVAGEARVWDTATGTVLPGGVLRHQAEVHAVAFSPEGRYLATGGLDRAARVFDRETLQPVGQPLWHGQGVWAVLFPDDRRLVTGGEEGAFRVWDLAPGPSALPPLRSRFPILATAAHPPTGHIVVGGLLPAEVWDARTRARVARGWTHELPVLAAEYDARGTMLALGTGMLDGPGSAVVFGPGGKLLAGPFPHEKGGVLSVAFSPDGKRLATGCADGTARLWEIAKPPEQKPIKFSHSGKVYAVRFSPDGGHLFSGGSDKRGRLWNLATRSEAAELEHPDAVLSVAFAKKGKEGHTVIVTGYAGAAMVWDWKPGKEPEPHQLLLPHGPAGVFAVALSPDGKYALTGGTDGTARWWDVDKRKALGPVWRPGPIVRSVHFFGTDFVAAGTDLKEGRVLVIPRPAAVTETPREVSRWVQLGTGIGSHLAVLTPDQWRDKRGPRSGPKPAIEVALDEERGRQPAQWNDGSAAPPDKKETVRRDDDSNRSAASAVAGAVWNAVEDLTGRKPVEPEGDGRPGFLGRLAANVQWSIPADPSGRFAGLGPGFDTVAEINVRQLLGSEVVKKYALEQLKQALEGQDAKKLLGDLGIDPIKDVDRVVIGLTETKFVGGADTRYLLIVHGKFDAEKLHKAAEAYSKKDGDKFQMIKDDGTTTFKYLPPDGLPPVYAAVVGNGMVVVAGEKKLITDARSAIVRGLKLDRPLQALIDAQDREAGPRPSVLVVSLLKGKFDGLELPDETPIIPIRIEGLRKALPKIETATVSVKVGADVDVKVTFGMKDEDAAGDMRNALEDILKQLKPLAQLAGAADARAKSLTDILAGIKISSKGKDVTVTGKVTDAQLGQIVGADR